MCFQILKKKINKLRFLSEGSEKENMDIKKNYPWLSRFNIQQNAIQEWEKKSHGYGLTFYCLKNRFISSKSYFDWALDYYKIPRVQDMYFEEHLMKKKEWSEIKDIYDWTEEILPIAFSNNIIFVGCLELNEKVPKRLIGFDMRVVLASQKSLEITWKFIQTLSEIIEKTFTGNIVYSQKWERKNEEAKSTKGAGHLKLQSVKLQNTFRPDIPSEKKSPPFQTIQSSSQKPFGSSAGQLKSQINFPEEERSAADKDYQTFPGRPAPPPQEEDFIMKKDNPGLKLEEESVFEKNTSNLRAKVKSNVLNPFNDSSQEGLQKDKKINMSSGYAQKLEKQQGVTGTSFSILDIKGSNNEKLWDYARKYYCSLLILNVQKDKAYLDYWTGKIELQNKDDFYVDFKDYSLFKIVQRGYPYNGFVVESPGNKKFFKNIGWPQYPSYVTALPIKDSLGNIKQIVVGLSIKTFTPQEIKNIQRGILELFPESIAQAAA